MAIRPRLAVKTTRHVYVSRDDQRPESDNKYAWTLYASTYENDMVAAQAAIDAVTNRGYTFAEVRTTTVISATHEL